MNCPFCKNKMVVDRLISSLRCYCEYLVVKKENSWKISYNNTFDVICFSNGYTLIYRDEPKVIRVNLYFEFPDSIADFKIIANKMLTAIMYQQ